MFQEKIKDGRATHVPPPVAACSVPSTLLTLFHGYIENKLTIPQQLHITTIMSTLTGRDVTSHELRMRPRLRTL